MKKPFILLIALLSTWFVSAQDCKYYDVLMQKANQLWAEGKFEQAFNQLTAAREHCPRNSALVDAQFVAFTNKIAQKYREAEVERSRAEKETARADRSALINRMGALALQKSKTNDYPLAWHMAVQAYQSAYDSLEGRCTELVVNGIMHDIISDSTRWLYQTIGRPNEKINSAVFSPDAQSILTCGDKTIDLWDNKGQLIKTIETEEGSNQAVFSPDGQFILTMNRDRKVAHLRDKNGQLIKTIEPAGDKAIFSPDSQFIVTLNWDGQAAYILDNRGNLIKTIERAGDNVDFSPNGQFILFWRKNAAQLWDKTGQVTPITLEANEKITEATFYPACPDDQHGNQYILITTDTASGLYDVSYSLGLWDQNGKLIKTLSLDGGNSNQKNPVTPVFSPDGKYRLTWKDNVAQLLDENGQVIKSMVSGDFISDAAFFPACPDDTKGEQFILTVSEHVMNSYASLWDQNGKLIEVMVVWKSDDVGPPLFSQDFQIYFSFVYGGARGNWAKLYKNGKYLKGSLADIGDAVFLPARYLFLALRSNGTAELWDEDLQRITSFEGVRAAVFSPPCPEDPLGGQYILTTNGGTARLWSKNQQALKIFEDTDRAVFSPACLQDPSGGQFILTVGDGKARLWDKTGHAIKTLESEFVISKALFSPTGQRILTAGEGLKQLWDHNGLLLNTLDGSGYSMLDANFSPDGKLMLIHEGRPGRFNNFIATDVILYNENGDILNYISNDVGKAFFSPDGKRMLIHEGEYDGYSYFKQKTVQLWNEYGRKLGTFGSDKNPAKAIFSPDGKYILTIYENHQAQLFDPNGVLLTTLRDTIQDAIFSPDGQFILSRFQRNVNLWDKKGHLIKILDPSPRFIEYAQSLQGKNIDPSPLFMEYAPDGRFFWLSYNFDPMSMDLSIAAFDKTGQPFHIFENNSNGYSYSGGGITFSPDGESILEFFGTTAKLWNKNGQVLKATFNNITGALFSPACPADPKGGQFMLTWGGDQTKLWDKSGQPLRTIYGPVESAKFSPDGQYIMTQAGKSWKLWEGLPLYIRNHFNLSAADLLRGGSELGGNK